MEDNTLAKVCNIYGIQILKKQKKSLLSLLENMNLDPDITIILKNLIKQNLHDSYNEIVDSLTNLAENKQVFLSELYKLEEFSKAKRY